MQLVAGAMLPSAILPGSAADRRLALIGQVWLTNPGVAGPFDRHFRQGLQDLGYVEGRNIAIVSRYAEGDGARLPQLMSEMAALRVDALLVSPAAVDHAKVEAGQLAVVCATIRDPVENGLAVSLAHPGGNLTGLALQRADTDPKRFELLKEVVPGLKRLGVLYEAYRNARQELKALRVMATRVGVEVTAYEVRNLEEIESALRRTEVDKLQALLVQGSALITLHRQAVFGSTAIRLPVVSDDREFAQAGALLTYGPDSYDLYRRAASHVDRILKGEKPAEIPIEQPTKFLLIANLKTAERLALKLPSSVLLRADELIR